MIWQIDSILRSLWKLILLKSRRNSSSDDSSSATTRLACSSIPSRLDVHTAVRPVLLSDLGNDRNIAEIACLLIHTVSGCNCWRINKWNGQRGLCFARHCTTQHALRGARHQIYDSSESRNGKEEKRRRTIRKRRRRKKRISFAKIVLCNVWKNRRREREREGENGLAEWQLYGTHQSSIWSTNERRGFLSEFPVVIYQTGKMVSDGEEATARNVFSRRSWRS